MVLLDRDLYARRLPLREGQKGLFWLSPEFLATTLLFGSLGATSWAIRGSDGWGGIDGTFIPGWTWGVLWYFVCRNQGIGSGWVPFWLGFGIALGGELGYGQYVSWIQGKFNWQDEILPVSPWVGFTWFAICGVGWGAPGGAALGWVLSRRKSPGIWLGRLLVPVLFAVAAWYWVQTYPGLFFPNESLGIYQGELGKHLSRTVYTNTQNWVVFCWWIGVVLVAAAQRDSTTLLMGLLIGGGFGIGFPLSAMWCLGYAFAPHATDWWKVWEISAGFILGLLYALACFLAIREVDRTVQDETEHSEVSTRWGLRVTLTLLVLTILYGGSHRLAGWVGLYGAASVDQYDWPPERKALFLGSVVLTVVVWGVFYFFRKHRPESHRMDDPGLVPLTVGLLVTGLLTIDDWKIAGLYVLLFPFSLLSLKRTKALYRETCVKPLEAGRPAPL